MKCECGQDLVIPGGLTIEPGKTTFHCESCGQAYIAEERGGTIALKLLPRAAGFGRPTTKRPVARRLALGLFAVAATVVGVWTWGNQDIVFDGPFGEEVRVAANEDAIVFFVSTTCLHSRKFIERWCDEPLPVRTIFVFRNEWPSEERLAKLPAAEAAEWRAQRHVANAIDPEVASHIVHPAFLEAHVYNSAIEVAFLRSSNPQPEGTPQVLSRSRRWLSLSEWLR
jgi:hypothetical protein